MLPDRFWAKVDRDGLLGHWLWTGAVSSAGYGMFQARLRSEGGDGVPTLVHRLAYEDLVGAIAEGLTIDHLCLVKLCVNPAHMEVVTQRTNILRSNGMSARHARATHCKRGHPKTPETKNPRNTECRVCRSTVWNKRRSRAA